MPAFLTTVAVVQSQDALAIAQSDYINSVFAHNVAKLAMARAIAAALKTGLDSWLSNRRSFCEYSSLSLYL